MSTHRLTVVRHAKSSWRFGNLDDFHRPLNRRGLKDCLRFPEKVVQKVARPDLLVSSDAVRAVQTAQAMADTYELFEDRIALNHEVYLAGYRTLLKVLRTTRPDFPHVMLVGHNPGLSELCNYLLPAPLPELPTLAVVSLPLRLGSWAEITRGCARCEHLLLPREILKEAS